MEVDRLKEERGFRLMGDFRPHSHHYEILKRMRASATQSGTLEVGGSRLCAFFTTWGDGYFPVFRVFEGGEMVAVRVLLGTEDAQRAMEEVTR